MKSAPVSHKGRRRGRRLAGDTPGREALLKAAISWFARRGFDGASLRSIAADAGVDIALIACLFGSKAELWQAVVEHLAERQAKNITRISEIAQDNNLNSAQALALLIELYAQISLELPEFFAFFMQEISNPGERLDFIMKKLIDPFSAACMPIIKAAMASGVIRKSDPMLYLELLLAGVLMTTVSPALHRRYRSKKNLCNGIMREAKFVFMNGI